MFGVRSACGGLVTAALASLWVTASAQGQASAPPSVTVFHDTGEEVPERVAAAIDAALIEALRASECCQEPTVSPAPYLDVQLTVGCDDTTVQCLSAIAGMANADRVVIRRVHADSAGTTTLQLVAGPVHEGREVAIVQSTQPAASRDKLAAEVPGLVDKLFATQAAPGSSQVPAGVAPASQAAQPSDSQASERPDSAPPPEAYDERAATGRDGPRIRALTWVIAGTGLGVLIAGIAVGASASSSFDEVLATPVRTRDDADNLHSDFDSVQARATAANVLMPIGGAALATGVVLLILDLTRGPQHDEQDAVSLDVGGTSLVLNGRFRGLQ